MKQHQFKIVSMSVFLSALLSHKIYSEAAGVIVMKFGENMWSVNRYTCCVEFKGGQFFHKIWSYWYFLEMILCLILSERQQGDD